MSFETMQRGRKWKVALALISVLSFVVQAPVEMAAEALSTGAKPAIEADPAFPPQTGTPATIARISSYVGTVGVRNATGWHQVAGPNVALYSGDKVVTDHGRCEITFNDGSVLRLDIGANITVEERPAPSGGVLRLINQYIGNLWFNIKRVTGTETQLATPTAVAAIRGTEGWQEAPDETHSTHGLTDGVEEITERVTQQKVTIHGGQQVTAIRGVGFSAITAVAALLTGRYPVTSSARSLPNLQPNSQGQVPPSERYPGLKQSSKIDARGVKKHAGHAGLSWRTALLALGAVAVAAVVIAVKENGGRSANTTSVGGPNIGVGPPR